MRITFIATLSDYWGGSEVLWVKTAALAHEKGHQVQVVVYSQKEGLHPHLQQLKRVTSFVEMPNIEKPSGYANKAIQSVKAKIFPFNLKEVSRFRPDCIIVNQVHTYSAPFHPEIFDLLLNCKYSFFLISQFNTEHQCLNYKDIEKARLIFSKAEKFFFVSKRNKEVAERQIARDIKNAMFIDNPVNLSDAIYIPYPAEEISINFACVARFDVNYKGQDILFQILAQERWKQRQWHLNLYGSGNDYQYLQELCLYYKLENRISFHGYVASVKEIWATNQVLVMPSSAEGKPLALEEAMICGRIGIVSDVAGNPELIDDGVNGYIASSFYPKPFDEALERAWKHKALWKEMGRKAHEKIVTNLDLNPEETLLREIMSVEKGN